MVDFPRGRVHRMFSGEVTYIHPSSTINANAKAGEIVNNFPAPSQGNVLSIAAFVVLSEDRWQFCVPHEPQML